MDSNKKIKALWIMNYEMVVRVQKLWRGIASWQLYMRQDQHGIKKKQKNKKLYDKRYDILQLFCTKLNVHKIDVNLRSKINTKTKDIIGKKKKDKTLFLILKEYMEYML